MSNFRVNDVVECPRIGPGHFKVLKERKEGHSKELLLGYRTEAGFWTSEWIYEVHCTASVQMRIANGKARVASAESIGRKILEKPRRKR